MSIATDYESWQKQYELDLKNANEKGFIELPIASSASLEWPRAYVKCPKCKGIIEVQDVFDHIQWHRTSFPGELPLK